mgnify:CR=1 FL=1
MNDPKEVQKSAREFLAELLEIDEGMTPWEVDFIENTSHWAGDFSLKQITTINRIYDRLY